MGKLLPVRESASPCGFIQANLDAVRAEFFAEAERLRCDGGGVLARLQRLLMAYEVLSAVRDGFKANGWDGEPEREKDTRVLVNRR